MMILKAASELGFSSQFENGKHQKDDNGVIVDFTSSEMDAINAKAIELQSEWDALDYSRKREAEYAKLNQFEMLYDKGMVGWKAEIKKIKDLYPKP